MPELLKIGLIVGSNSVASINLKLAKGLMNLLASKAQPQLVDISHLPFFNRDLEQDYPAVFQAFKEMVGQQDGIVFVTPEYNRSIPAVLKNALDAGSRPWGKNIWLAMPAAVIGTSPGGAASGMAQQHLRNILAAVGMPTLPQPEAFVRWRDDLMDEQGQFDASTEKFLNQFLDAALAWIARNRRV